MKIVDYSTGTQYKYTGTDGSWQSIQAIGGSVNPHGSGGSVDAASTAAANAPVVTSASPSIPMPFGGTHKDTSSAVHTGYPWVGDATTLSTATTTYPSTYPGLPSGWTVSDSGKVVPPSSAPVSTPSPLPSAWHLRVILTIPVSQQTYPLSPSSLYPSPLLSAAPSLATQYETVTGWDSRGFRTTYLVPVGG